MSDESGAAQIERLNRMVRAVLDGFEIEAGVSIEEDEDGALLVVIEGSEASRLVENGGELVDAIQYIGSQTVGRVEGALRRRVVVDADGYRGRRAAALEQLAVRAADEAMEHGAEIELDVMTPQDRRLVHLALRDRSEVTTRSEGDEPQRRIIVEPAE